MITNFKIYESSVFDENKYFIDHTEKGYESEPWFDFVWSINKKTKMAYHISFSYKPSALTPKFGLRLEDLTVEEDWLNIKGIPKKKFLTPDEFFKKYPEVCTRLYYKVKEKVENVQKLHSFIRIRYNTLLKTLEDMEDFQIYLQTKKYNL